MKTYSLRVLLASALIPVGALVASLVIQAEREKWPFSPKHLQSEITGPTRSTIGSVEGSISAAARVPVQLTAKQLVMLGVQFEAAEVGKLEEIVSGVATAVIDESRVVEVHTRVSGWLEQLYVRTTGQNVRTGQALGAVFSQELYASQLEYLAALQRTATAPASVMLAAGRTRLKVLGMSEAEINRIERTRQANRLVTIAAPRSGFVLDRGVTQGMTVDPSTNILSIADVSQLWVVAEVAETDAARLRVGSRASLTFPQSGRPPFIAKVEFIYPMLTERTRSVRVRMTVPNMGGALRPGMYGSAQISAAPRYPITIGRDAVVDTGISQHVFIRGANSQFEPRQVKIGARVGDRVEVLEGLAAGEQVVSAGVFLLDSESRLRASGATGHGAHGGSSSQAPPAKAGAAPADAPAQHEHRQ